MKADEGFALGKRALVARSAPSIWVWMLRHQLFLSTQVGSGADRTG